VNKTWAPKGKTPFIKDSGSWKKLTLTGVILTDADGKHPRLFLRSLAGNVNSDEVIKFLKDLKRHLRGKKLLLFMDGLPAHRSKKTQEYIKAQKHWLKTARFPSYAPELNPIEYLWGTLKKKHLGNLYPELAIIGKALRKARRKIGEEGLLLGFLRASGLYC